MPVSLVSAFSVMYLAGFSLNNLSLMALIVAAVLYALEAGGPAFLGVPLSSWVAGIGGLWAIRAALPRR